MNAAQRLYMNAIGKVRLVFDEAAIIDPYEQNRNSGSFILIDPETNNTVAGISSGVMGGALRRSLQALETPGSINASSHESPMLTGLDRQFCRCSTYPRR
ncbi:hypothetical protein CO662_07865 [Rhizobium anhuiense]|uniref:GTP-eEF1A C-terminal domain-containing protein n=1 Tax=Rhizobium anhuiense TaxID=1184720 RepID=A0ABX4JDW5_9HYPH|nr:hypothetical protein CO668_10600 [Rhizobium anhuiense]PDS52457.1 hypothetical protein CO662_07865 [Rhizobium anhuiense]